MGVCRAWGSRIAWFENFELEKFVEKLMRTVMIIPAVFRPSIFNKNIDYSGAGEDFKEFLGSSLNSILFTKEVNFFRQNFY